MDDPKKIGRYEIIDELGKGAMGKVYRAKDPNIERMVALKTMRLDVHGTDDEEILRRFRHEAKLAGVLNHGNIVTIYDAGEFEGVFYMAMEYLEGSTLQTVLHQQRTLSADRIVEIARQVCAGLDYAHAHNVIHRDIKPANIMITKENAVKIMDFGIAKSAASMTTTGQVLGTPTYMSPEQVRGKTLDGRSDLFSFGVVLYEMVVGEKPFTGQTITTIIYKIINEPAIPPRELDVTVHPGISTIIMKALAKSPEERYQTGADLVRDLVNYKSVGTDTSSTKIIAAAAPAGEKPQPPKLAATATPTKSAKMPSVASVKPGESTVGVGIRIGNKPLNAAKIPAPPAGKNLKAGVIVGGSLLALVLLVSGLLWNRKTNPPQASGTAAQTTPSPVVKAPTSTAPDGAANAPVEDGSAEVSTKAGKTAKPSPAGPLKSGAKTTGQNAQPMAPAPVATAPGPAPAAEIPSDKGNLQVSSEPAGAKVVIAGPTPTNGITPFTAMNLEPGSYSVMMTKAGYIPATRSVRVIGGRAAAIGTDLIPESMSKLMVSSTPAGAEIFLDGKSTGKVTPAQFHVAAGEHKIEVKKSGFGDEQTSTVLRAGDTHVFAPKLEPPKSNPFRAIGGLFGRNKIPEGKGMVHLKSSPEGAEIVYNGAKLEKNTPAKFPLDPGTYRVTIRKEGFKPAHREFKIEKGKSIEVDVKLEKK